MAKRRVPWFNKPNQFVEIESDATIGAVVGENLYWPDGSLVTEADFGGSAEEVEEVVNQIYLTSWASVLSKPQNIIEAAALTGAGVIVRQVSGDWLVRTIEGTAGNITVTNGTGDAGNPIVNLATVADSGTGVLLAITRDGFGRVTGTRAITAADLPAFGLLSADAMALTGVAYYPNDSFAFSADLNIVDTGVNLSAAHIFLNAGGGSGSWFITGLIGGSQGRLFTVANDRASGTSVFIADSSGTLPENNIKTPDGLSYEITPGSSVTFRWAYDATLANPGYWVFCAITSAPLPLNHRVDDITAAAGDIRFLLDKTPYQGRVAIYDDAGARMKLASLTGSGRQRYLAAPATGGEVYTVDYMTEEASPGATVMDDAAALAWSPTYPDGEVGVAYDYTPPPATGGTGPYTYSYTGTLPPGLAFEPSDGQLHGTPTDDSGSPYAFDVVATDSLSASSGDAQSVGIVTPVVYDGYDPSNRAARALLTDSNMVAGNTTAGYGAAWVRSVASQTSGKWRAQFLLSPTIPGTSFGAGVSAAGSLGTTYLGGTTNGWALWGNYPGLLAYHSNAGTARAGSYAGGDVLDILLDIDAGKGWYRRNGSLVNPASDPVAGTDPDIVFAPGAEIWLTADPFSQGATWRIRTNPVDITGTPVAGFVDGWPT